MDRYGPVGAELGRFATVGVVATATHFATALICSAILPLGSANLIGFAVAFAVSYCGHRLFTFTPAGTVLPHRRLLPRFALSALVGFMAGHVAVLAASRIAGMEVPAALALGACVPPAITFIITRFWVFRPIG